MPQSQIKDYIPLERNCRALALTLMSVALLSMALTSCTGAATSTGNQTATSTGNQATAGAPPPSTIILLRNGIKGGGEDSVVALNPHNGQALWRRRQNPGVTPTSPILQPTIQDGIAYVADSYYDPQRKTYFGQLDALDPATGHLLWRHVTARPDDNIGLDNEPVAANGVVYLASDVIPKSAQPQPATGLVEALDSRSGSVRWTKALPSVSSPGMADGLVILLSGNALVALHTSDGSVAWTFTPSARVAGQWSLLSSGSGQPNGAYDVTGGSPAPVVANHLIFVEATAIAADGVTGAGSSWFAVKTSDGSLAWQSQRSARGVVFTRPALNQRGDTLCFSAYSEGAGNFAMGLATSSGKTGWTAPMEARVSMCASVGNQFYLSESNQSRTAGDILALDSQNGRQLWKTATKPSALGSAVPAPPQQDGMAAVYAMGQLPAGPAGQNPVVSTLAVVQLSTGKTLWQHDFSDLLNNMPLMIAEGNVLLPEYSAQRGQLLVAYSLQSGNQAWTYASA